MSTGGLRKGWLRLGAAVHVGIVRLRVRRWQALLVVAGIALSTSLLVGILGASVLARERALQVALARLPADERAIRVDLFGLPVQQGFATEDRAARAALGQVAETARPVRVSFFHDALVGGQLVRLVAIDDLARFVRVRDGRLPHRCTPAECEVFQVGRRGLGSWHEGGIALVRTGAGRVRAPGGLGPAFQGLHTYGTQEGIRSPVVLIAPSTAAVERVPALATMFRVRSWMLPLSAVSLHSWDVDSLLARETRAQNALHEADGAFRLDAPDDALLASKQRGTVSARRMVLLGASSSVLLLGFVVVAAMGLRRGLASERRRLLQHGATRWQVRVAVLVEVAALTLVGLLLGVATGAAVVAVLAGRLDAPPGAVVRHALLEPQSLLAVGVAWLLATGTVLVASASDGEGRSRRRLLDVAALGSTLAIVVGVRRQGLDAERLSEGASPTILLVLPLLVCFVGAVLTARLLGPLMRVGERLSRRGRLALGLALVALARAPARTAAAGAFLAVAVGLTTFATAYGETLARSARDEAGFRVPLAATVEQGRAPLFAFGHARSIDGYSSAYPVLRRSADAASTGTSAQGVSVVGVPTRALETMFWRHDFSSVSRARLVAQLGAGAVSLRGTALPADAKSVRLEVAAHGEPLRLGLALVDQAGTATTLPLGRAGDGVSMLSARLPRAAGEVRVTGLELALTRNGTEWFYHLNQEGRLIRPPDGRLEVRSLRAITPGGATAVDPAGWVVKTQGGRVVSRRPLSVSYTFDEAQTIVVRARQETDGRALPVVASRDVAAAADPDGTIALDFGGVQATARVVGVARRFPTIDEGQPFVVAEESRLRTLVDADAPGTGTPDEAWLPAERPVTAAGASVALRGVLLESLQRDPLARGVGYVLGVSALLALALAGVGVWLAAVSDLYDERRDLVDLEAQGAAPNVLQSYLRIRTLALLAFGVLAGLALGTVLARLVVSLVRVSATTTVAEPPLLLVPGWTRLAVLLAGFAVLVAIALEVTLRAAFRQESPAREVWSVE